MRKNWTRRSFIESTLVTSVTTQAGLAAVSSVVPAAGLSQEELPTLPGLDQTHRLDFIIIIIVHGSIALTKNYGTRSPTWPVCVRPEQWWSEEHFGRSKITIPFLSNRNTRFFIENTVHTLFSFWESSSPTRICRFSEAWVKFSSGGGIRICK